MSLAKGFKWLDFLAFNKKWTCNACGKEIFEDEYFCKDCKDSLPFIDGAICRHCGRKTVDSENYCSTCKNHLVSIDLGRSAFNYQPPVSDLIKKLKNRKYKYLAEIFAEYLAEIYLKNYIKADLITFVPMTKKAERKRGFNQSKLLAQKLSLLVDLPTVQTLIKSKDTLNQKSLNKKQRLENLIDAYKIVDRKVVEDKVVVVVDDVTTTGATAQAVAEKLKKYKAKTVVFITVASVPPVDGY